MVFAALTVLALQGCAGEPPPTYGPAPEFALQNQHDATVRSSELRGQVLVVDFIFTRCTTICPVLTGHMAELQRSLPADEPIRFLSITVDPDFDTPPVLSAYADKAGADPARWHFLGADRPTVDAVVEGFKQGLERPPPGAAPGPPDITHSQRMILVDAQGQLRGFYRTDEAELSALETAALGLARGRWD